MVFVNKAVLNSTPELPFTFLVRSLSINTFYPTDVHIHISFIRTRLVVHPTDHRSYTSAYPGMGRPRFPSAQTQVALPEINAEMAYKLLPVVSVGVIALGKLYFHHSRRLVIHAIARWGACLCKVTSQKGHSFHIFLIRFRFGPGRKRRVGN